MHALRRWGLLAPFTLMLAFLPGEADAAPALTTVQDTLYRADGTKFQGVATVEWSTFQAYDATMIAGSSVVVPITNGNLRVRLAPTSNASPGAHYRVRYHAEGKVQFSEVWNVMPSGTPVSIAAVRVAAGSLTGGAITPPESLAVTDIEGLADELAARPVKGFGYAPDRILKSGPTGALEAVQGTLSDCIRVDGTTGPCGGGTGGGAPGFTDQETPTGIIDGTNTVFSLHQAPDPVSSLALYRNGVRMKEGLDYTLSSTTVTFAAQAAPQSGDVLLASYRVASAGAIGGSLELAPLAEGAVSNIHVAAAAGIAESKLALAYPTHSNANDPSAEQKAALSGTAGAPSATNKYVTDADARLTNSRTAVAHPLLGAAHSDTAPGTVARGDLIVGSNASGFPAWARLPLGTANRCLVSNGVDAVWNTCLYTGFHAGAIAFTDAGGSLAQTPMHLMWDSSNRRLSVGSNSNASTLAVHDGAAGGVTILTVRGGAGQGSEPLQSWRSAAGDERAAMTPEGVLRAARVEANPGAWPAWRETGVLTDPAALQNGDSWYHAARMTRKTHDAGQTHTSPQVLCSSEGGLGDEPAWTLLGSCAVPGGLLQAGDRLAIRATWRVGGPDAVPVRWRWGTAAAGVTLLSAGTTLFSQQAEAAIHTGGAVLELRGAANGWTAPVFLDELIEPLGVGLPIAFEANPAAGTTMKLVSFTVVRYPAQANP